MQGVIGDFPGCMADLMGIKDREGEEEKRDAAIVKRLTRRLFQDLQRIHVRLALCHAAKILSCRSSDLLQSNLPGLGTHVLSCLHACMLQPVELDSCRDVSMTGCCCGRSWALCTGTSSRRTFWSPAQAT